MVLMKYLLITFLFLNASTALAWGITVEPQDKCVILLHGLGRTSWSMMKLEHAFRSQGYSVWNESYVSKKQTVEESSKVIEHALQFCRAEGKTQIYFVTHSLGGILVRYFFQDKDMPEVKGVVMLAPPNHGSEVSETYGEKFWLEWSVGVAGKQLGTGPESLPNTLKPISLPVGVIAGTVSSDPWFNHLFSGPHDGKVSVESAKLDEMKDFLTVESGHTFIMNSDLVLQQIFHFFETHTFQR